MALNLSIDPLNLSSNFCNTGQFERRSAAKLGTPDCCGFPCEENSGWKCLSEI